LPLAVLIGSSVYPVVGGLPNADGSSKVTELRWRSRPWAFRLALIAESDSRTILPSPPAARNVAAICATQRAVNPFPAM
jgi:hypothetical protein